jgi:hypothetical protein
MPWGRQMEHLSPDLQPVVQNDIQQSGAGFYAAPAGSAIRLTDAMGRVTNHHLPLDLLLRSC